MIRRSSADLIESSHQREMVLVRLLGIGAVLLTCDPVVQRGLLDGEAREKQNVLDKVIDAIRGKFGTGRSTAAGSSRVDTHLPIVLFTSCS